MRLDTALVSRAVRSQTSRVSEQRRFELFDPPREERLGPETVVLRGLARDVRGLDDAIEAVIAEAPLRHMVVPGGGRMSVGTTSCGALGWVSDRRGYRYEAHDPESGRPWPGMPEVLRGLATLAAARAGFPRFEPDSCLINRYAPRTKMGMHRDADERDFAAPIVSVSLGLPATFVLGGLRREDPTTRVPLTHGDVVVWGGVDRLRYHAVLPVRAGTLPHRTNLTFRRAG